MSSNQVSTSRPPRMKRRRAADAMVSSSGRANGHCNKARCLVFIAAMSTYTALATANSAASSAIDGSSDMPHSALTNDIVSQSVHSAQTSNNNERRPSNFLRWRSTQEVTKTNDDYNVNSPAGKRSGVYIEFEGVGLQLGPVSVPFSTSALTTVSYDAAMEGAMEGLEYAIGTHLNTTLLQTSGIAYPGIDYTIGRFDHVQLDEVKFVEFVDTSVTENKRESSGMNAVGMGEGGIGEEEDEPVRYLQQTEQSMKVMITGGQAYYLYGPGGEFMTTLPNSDELHATIVDSLEGREGDGDLASQIREMATDNNGGSLNQNELTSEDGDLSMFENVQSVSVVEGLTFPPTSQPTTDPTPQLIPAVVDTPAPTSEPTPEPTNSPQSEPPTTADPTPAPFVLPIDLSEVTFTPAPSGEPTTYPPTTDSPESSSGGVYLDYNSEDDSSTNGEDSGDSANGGKPIISSSVQTAAKSLDTPNDDSNTKNIILASTVGALLVLSAAVALFVYKRRRRNDSDSVQTGERLIMKSVPMSRLTDDEDFNSGESDTFDIGPVVDEEMGQGGDGRVNGHGKDLDRDVESGLGGRDSMRQQQGEWDGDGHQQGSGQENQEDVAYNKMLANAMAIGSGGRQQVRASRQQQPDDSLIPQFKSAAVAAQKSASMDNLEAGDLFNTANNKSNDIEGGNNAEEDEDDDDTSKIQPLFSQDSLNQKYPASNAITSRDISDLDLLATNVTSKHEADKDLAFDDIEEAMKFAKSASTSCAGGNVVASKAAVDAEEDVGQAGFNSGADGVKDGLLQSTELDGSAQRSRSNINLLDDEPASSDTPSEEEGSNQNNAQATMADSIASHDILNDINALAVASVAERKRSSESKDSIEKARSRAQTPVPFMLSNAVPYDDGHTEIDVDADSDPQEGRATPKEPDEENYPHDILDAISEAARSTTQSLKADTFVPFNARRNVISPATVSAARKISFSPLTLPPMKRLSFSPLTIPRGDPGGDDPPGDVSCVSKSDDTTDLFAELRTLDTDVFADLQTVEGTAAPAGIGCGANIIQQTKELLPKRRSLICRQGDGRLDDDAGEMPMKKKWNPFSADALKCSSRNPMGAVVSDDECSDEDDVARPWKEKWDTDPFSTKRGTLRAVSPAIDKSMDTDGSNYDPDSDWDVSDAEVEEFGTAAEYEDDVFEARKSGADGRDDDAAAMSIWSI